MSDGIWSAASGAIAQLAALDVAAENVANASTPAFHGDRAVFQEYLTRAAKQTTPGVQPNRTGNLRYAAVGSVALDPTAGPITPTGRPLDAAIKGNGFFVVQTARGIRYTRDGSVQMAKDGRLLTRAGDAYLGADRRPLRAAPDTTRAAIGEDGIIRADNQTVGELLVVSFNRPAAMEKEGALLYRAPAAAGAPTGTQPALEMSALEMSNVSVVKGMVDIVSATRGFEACERAIDAFREADRRAASGILGG